MLGVRTNPEPGTRNAAESNRFKVQGAYVPASPADAGDPAVAYAYDDTNTGAPAAVPYVRLKYVAYPDGRQVHYTYPASGAGAALSRLDEIVPEDPEDPGEPDTTAGHEYAAYTYLGAGTVVQVAHPAVSGGLNLSYKAAAAGHYSGFDRFGRIVWQKWAIPSDPEVVLDRYFYGYDRNSNRLWRADRPDTGSVSGRDEAYYYDGLNRLVQAKRGILPVKDGNGEGQAPYPGDANGDGKVDSLDIGILRINWDPTGASDKTWARSDFNGDGKVDSLDEAILRLNWNATGYSEVLNRASAWSLDALGNWAEFKEDDDSTLDWDVLDQDRLHNKVNEIDSDDDHLPDAIDPDAITEGQGQTAWIVPGYDAAGNMTFGPKPGDETVAQHYVFDAWNRLVAVYSDDNGQPGDLIATCRYDGLRRRIQKTVEGSPDVTYDYYYNEGWQLVETRKDSDTDPYEQYVWDARYIDAPVVRFRDSNTDGDLLDEGDDTLYYTNDANMNVTALVNTSGTVVERVTYDPYGKPTFYDGSWTLTQVSGHADGTASTYSNAILYCGYFFDDESGLYHVRNRYLHFTLGWTTRDRKYYDRFGLNLYQYAVSSPMVYVDPMGLTPVKDRAIGFREFIQDVKDFEETERGEDCCCDRLDAISDKVRGSEAGFGSAGPVSSSGKGAGAPPTGLGWKYFGVGQGAKRSAWVDTGHFFFAAKVACRSGLSEDNAGFVTYLGGLVVESMQLAMTQLNVAPYATSSSAFSMEDPASNGLGGMFGAYYSRVCKEKKVSEALEEFFAKYGPYDNPQDVPGYDKLEPSQESLEKREEEAGYVGRVGNAVVRTIMRQAEFLGIK